MAGMYAVYHGPEGIKAIANRIHIKTAKLAAGLDALGFKIQTKLYFDTITTALSSASEAEAIHARAVAGGINLRRTSPKRLASPSTRPPPRPPSRPSGNAFCPGKNPIFYSDAAEQSLPKDFLRTSAFLTHPIFNQYHSETEILRYMRRLADRDLALDRAMIPLGSCTMKLNATTEMLPISWPEFANIHPFVPADQALGYAEMIADARQAPLPDHRLRRLQLPAQLRRAGRVRRASCNRCVSREQVAKPIARSASSRPPPTGQTQLQPRWPRWKL